MPRSSTEWFSVFATRPASRHRGSRVCRAIFAAIAILIILMVSFSYIFRNTMLGFVMHQVSEKTESQFHLSLGAENLQWNGFWKIHADKISLNKKSNGSSIFFMDFNAEINPFCFFSGAPFFNFISWKEAQGAWNLRDEIKENSPYIDKENGGFNWVKFAKFISYHFPNEINAGPSRVSISHRHKEFKVKFDLFKLIRKKIVASGEFQEDQKQTQNFLVEGNLTPAEFSSNLKAHFSEKKSDLIADNLPVVKLKQVQLISTSTINSEGEISILGSIISDSSTLNHSIIWPHVIVLPAFTNQFSLDLKTRGMAFESSIKTEHGLCFCFSVDTDCRLDHSTFRFSFPVQPLQTLQKGLQDKAFSVFNKMNLTGEIGLEGYIQFSRVQKKIHSLQFQPKGKQVKWNDQNEFMSKYKITAHTVPFNKIPRSVAAAVILAEDPGFFSHGGFDEIGFKVAMQENMNENRFARGGGTITMQLARNLFLNQDKNLFRKIEECLITFVMEQPGLFTKEKILESYLTIAEWGPGISGIVNASQFYFGKAVSELTYDEAIFLALLLPNPKQYKTLFDKNGKLKESFLVVMEGLRFSMWEHGFLPDTEFEKEISLRLK